MSLPRSQTRLQQSLAEEYTFYDQLSRKQALSNEQSHRFATVITKMDRAARAQNKPVLAPVPFTPEDDAALIAGRKAGLQFAEIGEQIGRVKGSCVGRYALLVRRGLA